MQCLPGKYSNAILCTEKIRHAIAGDSWPIYSSANTTIYETFSRNSFIDVSDFESFEQLYDFIKNLSDEEYVERYNKCLEVLQSSCVKRSVDTNRMPGIIDHFIKEIRIFYNK